MCSCKTKQKGENRKPGKKSTETPLRPHVQKGPRKGSELKFQENPKNARGPEWHPEFPRRKRQEAGRTAKRAKTNRGGTQRENRKNQTSACGGVLLLPELYLLKNKKREKQDDVDEKDQNKREKKIQTGKNKTWHQENFSETFSGSNRQNIRQKHQDSTKHTTNTDTKNKSSLPNCFSNSDPKKRRTAKNRQKDAEPDTKTKKWKKTDSTFPLQKGKKNEQTELRQYGCRREFTPSPFQGQWRPPSWHFCWKGGGGRERPCKTWSGSLTGQPFHTLSPKKWPW